VQIAERYYGRAFLFVVGVLALASIFHERLNSATALAVLVVGVILLGLPHGALDPMVAGKALANYRYYSPIAFYASYLILALSYSLLWSRYPTLGLSSFLVIAAVHFGSDRQHRGSALTRICYGLTIVTLPALAHPVEVASIYTALGTAQAQLLVHISMVLAVTAVIAGGTGAVVQFKQRGSDLYEFLAIVVGATFLGPLVFFACYFCLLHSPRHLLETAGGLGIASLRKIYLVAAPVVMTTMALGGIFWFVVPDISYSSRLLTLVFVGLASLTVPHMLLDKVTEPSL
jgi:Brp/Blh family beta-carotene 15,15'-monooxygenase